MRAYRRTAIAIMGMLALLAFTTTPAAIGAHELEEASITVIVRPGGHVQLRLQVPYADLLRRAWAPRESPNEFLVTVVNMPAAKFERELARFHETVRRELRLVVNGKPAAISNWTLPAAAAVQSQLRTQLMASLATPGEHSHGERITVEAETRVSGAPSTLQVGAPSVFGQTLLTIYRPQEQWVRGGELSQAVSVTER